MFFRTFFERPIVRSFSLIALGAIAATYAPLAIQSVVAQDGKAAPSGPAGGDLAGRYPNPRIAVNAITQNKIAEGAVRAKALGIINKRSQTSSTIAAGGNGSVTALCLDGEQLIGGGNDGFFDVFVVASRDNGSNGWTVFGHNNSAGNRTITAHAYCLGI